MEDRYLHRKASFLLEVLGLTGSPSWYAFGEKCNTVCAKIEPSSLHSR